MELVQMNARIDATLKDAGDQTLEKIGWSLAQTMRNVWRYLAAHRDDPQTVVRTLCDEPASEAELAEARERARKIALAERGSMLFYEGCDKLGLNPTAFSWESSDEDLLAEALLDRLEERGLA